MAIEMTGYLPLIARVLAIVSAVLILAGNPGGFDAAALAASVPAPTFQNPVFDPPVNLSNDPGSAEDHQIVAVGTNVYVAWSDDTPGNYEIFFRRSTDRGATWGAVVNLSQSAKSSRYPKIAATGGSVYVVWGDFTDNFMQQDIFVRRSADGGSSFEPGQLLSSMPGVGPTVAADGTTVYVAWGEASGGVRVRRSLDSGSSFESAQTLSSTAGETQVAARGARVYVVWSDADSLSFRRSTDWGATFEPIQKLGPGPTGNPQLKAAGDNLYVAWIVGGPADVYFAHSTDGGVSFTGLQNISNNAGPSNQPRLAVGSSGIFVVWIDDTSGNQEVLLKQSKDNGNTFGSALNLSETPVDSLYPRIEASGIGVYIVWQEESFAPYSVDVLFRASTDGGDTFGPATNLSNNGLSATPELSLSENRAYVIWRDFSFGAGDILFRSGTLPADLIETSVSDPPISKNRGTSFSVTDVVKNQGPSSASSSKTRYYLSKDSVRDAGDKLLIGGRPVPGLAPDQTSTGSTVVTIPGNTTLGTYFLLASADDTGLVVETSEANNCTASTGTIAVTAPDLKEIAISDPPASVVRGGRFRVTDTTANVGTGPASASTTLYYLSLDKTKSADDVLLIGGRSVPSLAVGAISVGSASVTVPGNTPALPYFVLACADATRVVKESKEGNNCRASASKVQVTAP